jgi:hypothetical protein
MEMKASGKNCGKSQVLGAGTKAPDSGGIGMNMFFLAFCSGVGYNQGIQKTESGVSP